MNYIAQRQDYWIHSSALAITLNALGSPNRIQGSVSSGAVIMAFKANVNQEDTLGWNAAHQYKTWPLSCSPTYFNSDTAKYVYVAIPRTDSIGTQAVVVFPSEKLDILGQNEAGDQIGSTDYLYIWLQAKISATDGTTARQWASPLDLGILDTDEGRDEQRNKTEWFEYSFVTETVTFLKRIAMSASSWFLNLRLGDSAHNLTGVATAATEEEYIDADFLVATPSYIEHNYLSKQHDDTAHGNITFEQNIDVEQDATVEGNLDVMQDANIEGVLQALMKILTNKLQSDNYEGDGAFDAGFGLFKHKSDANQHSYMVVDELFVRIKAIFNELEIRKISFSGGDLVFSHAGGKVLMVRALYDSYDLVTPDLSYDQVQRGVFSPYGVYDPETHSIDLKTATLVPSAGAQITGWRLYFMKDDGTTATRNWWKVDDQARCQTFGVLEPGHYEQQETTYYWRLVTEVGTETLTVKEGEDDERQVTYDYIDVSNVGENVGYAPGSTEPKVGDQVVQMGNRTDAERQDFIMLDITSADSPALKMYNRVSGYLLEGKAESQISRKDTHITAEKFIIRTDYGLFQQPKDRGNWSDITPDDDNHRRCYYYDLVQHDGGTWLCIVAEPNYTTDEPSESSAAWRVYAQKGAKGDSITKKSETYRYATNNTGVRPAPTSQDWQTTKPTLQQGYWLYTETTITWSDNSTTVLYTDERNPNDGDSGDDAINVIVTPASLIVNQDLENKSNLSDLTEAFVVQVKKGSNSLTVNSIQFATERDTSNVAKLLFLPNGGSSAQDAVGDGTINGNTLTLKKIGMYTVQSEDYYYDSAYATLTINYTDGTTQKSINNVRINVYANLLGTWSEEVKDGVKHEIAQSTWFDLDSNGNIVESERLGTFERSSKQNLSRLDEQTYVTVKSNTLSTFYIPADGDYRIVLDIKKATGTTYNTDLTKVTLARTSNPSGTVSTWADWKYYDRLEKTFKGSEKLITGNYVVTLTNDYIIDNLAVYSATKTKYSEINQTVDSITSTVKASTGNKNLFSFAKCQFRQASVDCGYPAIQSYGLFLKFAGSTWDTGRMSRVTIPSLEQGNYYTISFQIKMTYGTAHIDMDLGDSAGQEIEATTSWQEKSVTLQLTTSQKHIDFGIRSTDFDSQHANYALLRHIKIEEGKIATAFTISSDDANYVTNVRPVDEWMIDYRLIEDTTVTCPSGKKVYKTNALPDAPTSQQGQTSKFIDYIVKNGLTTIEIGKVYTLSFWVKASANNTNLMYSYLYPEISAGQAQDFIEVDGQSEAIKTDGQTYIKITTEWKKHYVYFFVLSKQNSGLVNCIPLRLQRRINEDWNNSGTVYISDVQFCEGYVSEDNNTVNESYSEIKQTADSIKLFVTDGLENTGINITNGTIDLTAAKIVMSSGGQGQTIVQGGKIKADYIDAQAVVTNALSAGTITAGTATINGLKATNVDVSGKITATSGDITGQMKIVTNGSIIVGSDSSYRIKIAQNSNNGYISMINSSGNNIVLINYDRNKSAGQVRMSEADAIHERYTFINPYSIESLYNYKNSSNQWNGDNSHITTQVGYRMAETEYEDNYVSGGIGSKKFVQIGINSGAVRLRAYNDNGYSIWPDADSSPYPQMTKGLVHVLNLSDLKYMLDESSYNNFLAKVSVMVVQTS